MGFVNLLTGMTSCGWMGGLAAWLGTAGAWYVSHWCYWHILYCVGRSHYAWPAPKLSRQEQAHTTYCWEGCRWSCVRYKQYSCYNPWYGVSFFSLNSKAQRFLTQIKCSPAVLEFTNKMQNHPTQLTSFTRISEDSKANWWINTLFCNRQHKPSQIMFKWASHGSTGAAAPHNEQLPIRLQLLLKRCTEGRCVISN
jgi:hypothetical protein